ncbi:alpha-L-rhamnosidase [Terriglobus aquaticus]|uniref:alpha-L-rhamnosidase n=1 Tax=Terriglobus aquaticus TaxID=940139 RepID=A0ABW9KL56_9BACT|nr:alpha-L-rhamnosidase [Terriglobus aquaticus]
MRTFRFSLPLGLINVMAVLLMGSVVSSSQAKPMYLRVDARSNPLGVDESQPTFSWQSDDTAKNWRQTAYRIEVATTAAALAAGKADLWDSGQVASDESLGIGYRGKPLQPRTRYYWRVHTWDQAHVEQVSAEHAWWETGLMGSAWQARWIRYDDPVERQAIQNIRWLWLPQGDPRAVADHQQADFRLTLHLDSEPESAVLHCLSGGTFTAEVNGQTTGHKQDWSSFDRENILRALRFGAGASGDNEIVVHTTARGIHDAATNANAFAAAIFLREANKRTRTVVTDGAWQARSGSGAAWQAADVVGPLSSLQVSTGSDRRKMIAAPDRISTEVSLLRKGFSAPAGVLSARLYITALGAYRASLNGVAVGHDVLTPGFTDFHKRVLYQTYDVTDLVHSGRNAFGIQLGGGWHSSPLLWAGLRDYPGPDMVRAELVLTLRDGHRQTVVTDASWMGARDATDSSEIYGGESYDARLAQNGWNRQPFTNTAGWQPVQVGDAPQQIAITAEADLPPHVEQSLKPVAVKDVQVAGAQTSAKVFDMGQNMVGVVRLRVRGERGRTIRLRFAERLQPDGTVYTENLRNADATDEYTLRGGGWEEWTPVFTFHGFRYVQVDGLAADAGLDTIVGEVENSLPQSPSMRFSSSSTLLNGMFQLGLWGQRGNFVSIPTDCPQRDERMGWMGDAGVFWRTGSYNYDIDAFSRKFMDDVTDAQDARGVFMNISPNLLRVGPEGTGAPGWGDAGVLVPYATWQQYGDRSVIDRNWDAMERWMQFIERSNPDGLRRKDLGPNYADWLAPDPHTPSDLVATAYWALITRQMEAMARATQRTDEADRYAALYRRLRASYRSAYIGKEGGVTGNTQTAYVLSLYTGMAEPAERAAMVRRLVADIQSHGNHLTTGFLGTPFLLTVLDREGRGDVAYQLLLSDTYPSWGYMVRKGATTWWERWNGDTGDPGMNSYNHYAFGSVMAWVYSRVSGIATDEQHPGYHHLVIAPVIDAALAHARTEFDSPYGTVVTDWTRSADGSFAMTVRLPANTTATVRLPAAPEGHYLQDGSPLPGATAEIGSGQTSFVSR